MRKIFLALIFLSVISACDSAMKSYDCSKESFRECKAEYPNCKDCRTTCYYSRAMFYKKYKCN